MSKLKREIKKFASFCAYCDYFFTSYEEKTIDHIIPRIKQGKSKISNMVCCCEKCNRDKADKDLKEFINKDRLNRLFIYIDMMRKFPNYYADRVFKKVIEII